MKKRSVASISDARARLAGAKTPQQEATANTELSNALSRLLVVVENYPNLKADKQFTQLMDELAGTENRIAVARKDYNDQVATYNKKVKSFPGAIVARLSGFEQKEYFQADPKVRKHQRLTLGENDHETKKSLQLSSGGFHLFSVCSKCIC